MAKTQLQSVDPKTIIICLTVIALLVLVIRSSTSSNIDTQAATRVTVQSQNCPSEGTCSKLPASLADAILHYATSKITPQQTIREISVTDRVLRRKSPCNFLVFGLGHDSPMWASFNHGGRTVFLEEDLDWIKQVTDKFPNLESYHVVYDTKVRYSNKLMAAAREAEGCKDVVDPRESKCELALKGLPKEIYEVEWDLIMVDAPTGYHEEAPGRMSAIYTAGLMARNRREGDMDIFVHDVNREIEDNFSKEFLCEGYMVEQEGRLRHFTIPSHRSGGSKPFCPKVSSPKP